MKKKTFVSTLLATTVLAGSLFATNVDAASKQSFKDVGPKHWAYNSIEQVVNKKLVAGYEDGTYRPKGEVTRAEFAAFLSRAFDGTQRTPEPFVDVTSNHWAVDAINEGIALGFIKPSEYPNNKFEPNKAMTRAEIARWLSNGLVASNGEYQKAINEMANSSLTLIPIPEYFKGGVNKSDLSYIGVAMGTGLLGGYDDATFKPNGKTTRAEVASILVRYLDAMKKKPEQFVGLNELREVANTGSNMKSIAGFTPHEKTPERNFTALRNEGYKFANGIGTTYVNRLLMIDMRDQKNPKGIFQDMFINDKGETIYRDSLRPGGFYYGVEHRFVPSKTNIDGASYLYTSKRPQLITTRGVFEELANKFGFSSGIHTDYSKLKVGQSKYMWFTGEIAPDYYEEYPDVVFISNTVNGKNYSFSKK